jgi:hypothetical protein
MFGKPDATSEKLLAEIRGLSTQVAELQGERDEAKEELKLADDIVRLKRTLTNLEIEKDRETEKHEREKREVKHMVGLEKKRQEFEVESAKRDVKLTLREENLKADRDRFEEQMKFSTQRFEREVGYLKELMGEVLDRLPTVKVDKRVTVGANGNGNHADEDDE